MSRSSDLRPLALTAALLCSAALLSSCGIKGDLDRPPPLWGSAKTAEPPTENQAENSDPLDTPAAPDDFDEDDDPGYGVGVADE